MRKIAFLLVLVILISSFASCNRHKSGEIVFYRKFAREVTEDGWAYSFVYEDLKDENADDSDIFKYSFYGINIRYQFDDEYIQTYVHETREGTVTTIRVPACLVAGSGPADEARDMHLINEVILDDDLSVEELLALDPDDYEFEAIDKDMFFRLMREALTGERQKENKDMTYWDRNSWAMLVEPLYVDGYKIQMGYMQECGCVDEMFIDVRFQTGEGYKDFVQLSDLVESGSATDEQLALYDKLQTITEAVKEQELFIADADSYKEEVIAGVSLARLHTFLTNVHTNEYDGYISGGFYDEAEWAEISRGVEIS